MKVWETSTGNTPLEGDQTEQVVGEGSPMLPLSPY